MDQRPSIFKMTESTYRYLDENSMGVCVNCRHTQDSCEPDARGYLCEGCMDETGKQNRYVYGTGELLIMGRLMIVENHEEENVVY